MLEIPALGAVTALATFIIEDNRHHNYPIHLVYGTASGILSMLIIEPGGVSFDGCWVIDDKKSAITCIKIFDLLKEGKANIIVGRDNGNVEVYSQESSHPIDPPTLIFFEDIGILMKRHIPVVLIFDETGESVRALECGLVNSADYNEVLTTLI